MIEHKPIRAAGDVAAQHHACVNMALDASDQLQLSVA
jgi:hypothetical protein